MKRFYNVLGLYQIPQSLRSLQASSLLELMLLQVYLMQDQTIQPLQE